MRPLLATSTTGCLMTHPVGLCWRLLPCVSDSSMLCPASCTPCFPTRDYGRPQKIHYSHLALRAIFGGWRACLHVQAPQQGFWGAGFRHEASILPFELHVLEVAIGDVCQLCSGLVKELESSGHPILDTLVKHVRPRPSPCPLP